MTTASDQSVATPAHPQGRSKNFVKLQQYVATWYEMLGHTAISITLDIYAHVLPDMQQDAATTMDRLLFSQE